jgi:hypothetical protein
MLKELHCTPWQTLLPAMLAYTAASTFLAATLPAMLTKLLLRSMIYLRCLSSAINGFAAGMAIHIA